MIACTDYLTRFTVTKALPNAETIEIAKFLVEEVILIHGTHREMISDQGRPFLSNLVKDTNQLCQTSHLLTTAYHPHTNVLTERFNKTLVDMLSIYVDVEQRNWDTIIPFVTFAYNSAKQDTTGFSPFFLVHGRDIETPLDHEKLDFPKRSLDGTSALIITRRLSDVTYEVQSMEVNSRRRIQKDVVHVLRLKPYFDPKKQLDDAGVHSIPRRPVTRSQTRLQRTLIPPKEGEMSRSN
ncbi:hypothetical protein AVEN_262939-1 [Araneus ventricosus]|uniref:Integrase catalytic domain-containing protein n=1 Tax=Araneus ventricosus TaxID=182803 RepID=A0A4Y2DG59_ARAVE|nr:hypothetical protein AVEN_262939-1 [Araneus ventricosus]